MDLEFYTRGPEYRRRTKALPLPTKNAGIPAKPRNLTSILLKILKSPNVASKEYVIRQYDHEVRASTVIRPLQGAIGKAAHGDAAVLRPRIDSWRALAISVASTPHFTAIDPFQGGAPAGGRRCRKPLAG